MGVCLLASVGLCLLTSVGLCLLTNVSVCFLACTGLCLFTSTCKLAKDLIWAICQLESALKSGLLLTMYVF